MLAEVNYVDDTAFTYWADTFSGYELAAVWNTASWIGNAPEILPKDMAALSYTAEVGVVRDNLSDLSTSSTYWLEIWINPWAGQHHGTYRIYGRLDNTSPDAEQDGITCELTMTGDDGSYTGKIIDYSGGVKISETAFTPGSGGYAQPGWFVVQVATNTITCYWQGTQVGTKAVTAHTGKTFGFGMNCTVDGGITLVDMFRIQYTSSTAQENKRNLLLASSNGLLYKEDRLGHLAAVSSSLTLSSSKNLHAAEHLQKCFIADHDNYRIKGTADGIITAGVLDKAGITWDAWSIDADDDVVTIDTIVNGTGDLAGVTSATSKITSVHATNGITLTNITGSCDTCSWRVERAPKVYNPADNTLAIWTATSGQVPTGCEIIARYYDRIWLAGSKDAPHVWYSSRQGDAYDWDTSAEDVGRAMAGDVGEAGRPGRPITALIPHSDDFMVIGCDTEIHLMRGDPSYGGRIDLISPNIGIIQKGAWCRGPGGEIIFLSHDGIHALAPGSASYPTSISRERLPRELLNVNERNFTILMQYDPRDRGVHIFLVPEEERSRLHFWLAWDIKGFWPVLLDTDHEPTSILYHTSMLAEDSAVLLGCRDGVVRRFHDKFETDEGAAISSYVNYVFPLNSEGFEGMLELLDATIAEGSGDIDWEVSVSDSPEDVATRAKRWDGTWQTYGHGGANYTARPKARGRWCRLKLSNGSDVQGWGMDSLVAEVKLLQARARIF